MAYVELMAYQGLALLVEQHAQERLRGSLKGVVRA